MRTVDAIKVMSGWGRQGMYLFDTNTLALIFEETGNKLRATIKRLMADGSSGGLLTAYTSIC